MLSCSRNLLDSKSVAASTFTRQRVTEHTLCRAARYSEKSASRTSLMTDADLLYLLRDCYTPAGPNIVAAGLVRSATLAPDPNAALPNLPPRYVAAITLHSPSTDETATAQLSAQVENRLLGLPSISRVELNLLPALFPIL